MDTNRKLHKNRHLITIKSELGAGTRGASLGPQAIQLWAYRQNSNVFRNIRHNEIYVELENLYADWPDPAAKRLGAIRNLYQEIVDTFVPLLKQDELNLVLSGDHSVAAGMIAAQKLAFPEQRLGLIWIDAHADLHSPYTSPSGNMHGMPLGSVLNQQKTAKALRDCAPETQQLWKEICELGGIYPKVQPEDMVMIGIRSLEKPEWALVHHLNINWFGVNEVQELGQAEVVRRTREYLEHCDAIYISFDVDSLDASLVPGTGTPVPGGLSAPDALGLLKGLYDDPRVHTLEITELNPMLDEGNRTTALVFDILAQVLEP
jgi:arginase